MLSSINFCAINGDSVVNIAIIIGKIDEINISFLYGFNKKKGF